MEVIQMKSNPVILDNEEFDLLTEINRGDWKNRPLSSQELDPYRQAANILNYYRKRDRNWIQVPVHNFATGKTAKHCYLGTVCPQIGSRFIISFTDF